MVIFETNIWSNKYKHKQNFILKANKSPPKKLLQNNQTKSKCNKKGRRMEKRR